MCPKQSYQFYTNRKVNMAINLAIDNIVIKKQDTVKYLGVLIDSNMKFISHINAIINTLSRNLGMMCRVRPFVGNKQLLCLYNATVLPYINYCCFIWGSGYAHHTKKLLTLQKRAMRIIEGIHIPQSANPVFKKYNILKIQDIAKLQMMLIMHRSICNTISPQIKNLFHLHNEGVYGIRQRKHFKSIFSTNKL